jgi:N-methylhydantoinase A
MLPGDASLGAIESGLAPLVERGLSDLRSDGIPENNIRIDRMLDMRYVGQSYELIIPYSPHFIEDFHAAHLKEYSYQRLDASVEIVNVRVQATGLREPPPLPVMPLAGSDPSPAHLYDRPVVFIEGTRSIPFYQGEKLLPGNLIHGPALVLRDDNTVLLVDGVSASVDRLGNLCLELSGRQS